MRKLLILTTLLILPALGCADPVESLRRFEVWKLQTFCEPTQPVVTAPPCTNPCPAPATPACGCPQGAPVQTPVVAAPAAVSAGYAGTGDDAGVVVPGSIKTSGGPALSKEELDGILKQP